jgi:hypothetical protein
VSELPAEFSLPIDAFERQRRLLRAEIAQPRHTARRRLTVVAAVGIMVLLGAVVATPARGVGGRLLDLIQGSPAPPEVQTYFAANDGTRKAMFAHQQAAGERLHEQFSPVIAAEARGVFAIDTADGPVYLWAAPTEDGRQCWLIQAGARPATGTPSGLGSCEETEHASGLNSGTFWTAERPSVVMVYARVYDGEITRIDVEVEGAPPIPLHVVSGYALGAIPKEARTLALIGRNAEGGEVTRTTLRPAEQPPPDEQAPSG